MNGAVLPSRRENGERLKLFRHNVKKTENRFGYA